jgi:hypothetical protein
MGHPGWKAIGESWWLLFLDWSGFDEKCWSGFGAFDFDGGSRMCA